MGVFHVPVRIRALDRAATLDVDMIVDTGATRTLLPRRLVDELGLRPDQRRPFRLANGEPVDRDMGWMWLECHGRNTYTLAILGNRGMHRSSARSRWRSWDSRSIPCIGPSASHRNT